MISFEDGRRGQKTISKKGTGTADGASPLLRNRGNRTPVELFLADVAGWESHVIRLVQAV